MALFLSALPIASLLLLISSYVEMKGDGWKMLTVYQRPIPSSARDIGSWQAIFLLIAIFSVVTNAGLTSFAMTTLDGWSINAKFWVFIGFQWGCFVLQSLIMSAIPDIPEEVNIQIQRTDFITSKILEKQPDEPELYGKLIV